MKSNNEYKVKITLYNQYWRGSYPVAIRGTEVNYYEYPLAKNATEAENIVKGKLDGLKSDFLTNHVFNDREKRAEVHSVIEVIGVIK